MSRIWNEPTRHFLYRAVVKEFGAFSLETWTPGSWAPRGIATRDNNVFYADIFHQLCEKKHKGRLPGDMPRSFAALQNQVAWATSAQRPNLDQECYRRTNRMAAYLAGFMTMTDIVEIEAEIERRANEDNVVIFR